LHFDAGIGFRRRSSQANRSILLILSIVDPGPPHFFIILSTLCKIAGLMQTLRLCTFQSAFWHSALEENQFVRLQFFNG
jgi:hypothetical protein